MPCFAGAVIGSNCLDRATQNKKKRHTPTHNYTQLHTPTLTNMTLELLVGHSSKRAAKMLYKCSSEGGGVGGGVGHT